MSPVLFAPNSAPSKKRRIDSAEPPEIPDPVLARWDLLWHTFWGKPALECFIKTSARIPDLRTLDNKASGQTEYEYLKLPNDGFFPCGLWRILVIETYKSLYAKLCQQDVSYGQIPRSARLVSLAHSTVITGQPGIGKTAGLSCILVWRLQEKKPTVYCMDSFYAYVFTNIGVRRVSLKDGRRIRALDASVDCCGLVDTNPCFTELPSQFIPSVHRQGRVVVATLDELRAFEQCPAETYYAPTWKWADLYCAGLLMGVPLAAEPLRNMYTKLGGVPRRCFRGLSNAGEELEVRTTGYAVTSITDINGFARVAAGLMPFNHDTSDWDALIRVEPTDDTLEKKVSHLLSNYVADLVYERLKNMRIRLPDSIDFLLRFPHTRSRGSKLFQMGVHRTFRDRFRIEPQALDAQAPSLSVLFTKSKCEAGVYFHTLANLGSGAELLYKYLIPLSSTSETIDSVYISKRVTVLFKITTSPSYDLDLKGITELTDELPASVKKRICIVFVVPAHETVVQWQNSYQRQKVVVPIGVASDSEDVRTVMGYNQYVYYFPMDRL